MQFEHKLAPIAVAIFKQGVEQLNACRLEYLRALGLAKEAEMKSAMLQQLIAEQVAIIEQTEGLPAPLKPYQLSADCSKLVGEVAERPAAAPVVEVLPAEGPRIVNGFDDKGFEDGVMHG